MYWALLALQEIYRPHLLCNRHLGLIKGPYTPQRGLIGEFLTNFRRPKMTRKTVLNPLDHPQMDPKWCQNVTQDGSFHGTKDGVCGSLS